MDGRLAKLSEGQVIDGQLECLYHGWQFNGSGQCTKIPQVSAFFSSAAALEVSYAPALEIRSFRVVDVLAGLEAHAQFSSKRA
jgi:nitrite reductase/ring-hydroxylating ferredoxin subunit